MFCECAQNPQREGPIFQRDVWICVGSSTDTVGSLRNPETRHDKKGVQNGQSKRFCLFLFILTLYIHEVVSLVRNLILNFILKILCESCYFVRIFSIYTFFLVFVNWKYFQWNILSALVANRVLSVTLN